MKFHKTLHLILTFQLCKESSSLGPVFQIWNRSEVCGLAPSRVADGKERTVYSAEIASAF